MGALRCLHFFRKGLVYLDSFALPRCTPEEVGFSSSQVETCIRELSHDLTTMNGFMAARHGKVFAECWWSPYAPSIPHSNHSFGKSYTATAIGIALGEGLLSLDEKMVDVFADDIREKNIVLPDGMEKITVENVLTMTNGMAYHPDMRGDFVYHYFTTPLAYEPGTRFAYNSTGSCMLGAIILKRTGKNLKEYLTPRLLEKIGIKPEELEWRKFRANGIDAEPGTFATTEANLRLAMLYLQGGKWNGEQVVPEEYVRIALSVHIPTDYAPEEKDGKCGYGYQLWACSIPGVFRFDGGQGQYGIIWPEKDLVISLHEGAIGPKGPQKTLDTLYTHLLNHISDEVLPENPEGFDHLKSTENSISLPNDPASPFAPDQSFAGDYMVTEGEFDPWLSASPPGNGDLFTMFRNPEKDIPIPDFSLKIDSDTCRMLINEGRSLVGYWDGSLNRHFTPSPFDMLGEYAASAYMETANTLRFHIHWLNGWFETELIFQKTDNGLKITTKKLRLNQSDNYLIFEAFAQRK